jgi:hypothetical protein
MRTATFATVTALALMGQAHAQTAASTPSEHQMHMATIASDTRQQLEFPAPMKARMLSNMRDHLQVISEVIDSMSRGQFSQASKIANSRLGLDSPSAEGCRPQTNSSSAQMSTPTSMEQMMAQFMPEGMRNIGLSMHTSASDFSVSAAESAMSGDGKPAWAALARVTQNCVACHSVYKLK